VCRGEECIANGLKAREMRALTKSALYNAHIIKDKTALVGDVNLLGTKLYAPR